MSDDAVAAPPMMSVADPPAAQATGFPLAITFTGSGSEYFRIWIVNLLLTVLTLGLYYPFAKVRRLRYFYGNTLLGDDAFDFHGNPWRMLRGYLLMAALMFVYGLAGNVSPSAGLVALLIVAAVWPALFRASMQFRLANTSWRGLRFHFTGDMAGAYRAMLPIMIPALMYLGAIGFVAPEAPGQKPSAAALAVLGLGALLAASMVPLFWWTLKRYQHGHLALGRLCTELRTGAGAFYGVYLRFSALSLACLVVTGAIVGLFFAATRLAPGAMALAPLVGGIVYVVLMSLTGAYLGSRLQNLIWTRTKSTQLRFESRLRARPLALLTLKNWLFIVLTLGLYLPFANVAKARMQLQAVTAYTKHPPDELVGALQRSAGDAAGDAAGDLIGFDIGL
jgi:uncharacterized membrane protein YjgN (DUF898 family)